MAQDTKDSIVIQNREDSDIRDLREALDMLLELGWRLYSENEYDSIMVLGGNLLEFGPGLDDFRGRFFFDSWHSGQCEMSETSSSSKEAFRTRFFSDSWMKEKHCLWGMANCISTIVRENLASQDFFDGRGFRRKWYDVLLETARMRDHDSRKDAYVNAFIPSEDLVRAYNRGLGDLRCGIRRLGLADYCRFHSEKEYGFRRIPVIPFRFGHPLVTDSDAGQRMKAYVKELKEFFDDYVFCRALGAFYPYERRPMWQSAEESRKAFEDEKKKFWGYEVFRVFHTKKPEKAKDFIFVKDPYFGLKEDIMPRWDYTSYFLKEGDGLAVLIENIARTLRFFAYEMNRRFRLLTAAYMFLKDNSPEIHNIGFEGPDESWCAGYVRKGCKTEITFEANYNSWENWKDFEKPWLFRDFPLEVPQMSPYTMRDALIYMGAWAFEESLRHHESAGKVEVEDESHDDDHDELQDWDNWGDDDEEEESAGSSWDDDEDSWAEEWWASDDGMPVRPAASGGPSFASPDPDDVASRARSAYYQAYNASGGDTGYANGAEAAVLRSNH